MINRKCLLQFLTVLLLIGLSPFAFADEAQQEEKPWTRFGLNLGGTFNGYDSNVRLGVKGLGLSVDAEELLDLDTSTSSFAADGFWRFTENRRHRLDLSWFHCTEAERTPWEEILTSAISTFPWALP
jgi:hypothetical protein